MVPNRPKKDFVGFIVETQTNDALAMKFFKVVDNDVVSYNQKTADLHAFFRGEGFTKVKKKDCKDIINTRNRLAGAEIPDIGNIPLHGKPACPGGGGY